MSGKRGFSLSIFLQSSDSKAFRVGSNTYLNTYLKYIKQAENSLQASDSKALSKYLLKYLSNTSAISSGVLYSIIVINNYKILAIRGRDIKYHYQLLTILAQNRQSIYFYISTTNLIFNTYETTNNNSTRQTLF